MFMELCKLGDLNKFFQMRDVGAGQKMEIMIQITEGLKYLHDSNVIHRDMKPGNILMQNDNPVALKLTDFDFCKFLEDDLETSAMTSNVGTNAFKALEFYQRQSDGKLRYHRNVDIYASGLTFLAILQAKKGERLLVPHLETADDSADKINPIASTIATRIKYKSENLDIVDIVKVPPQNKDWTPGDTFKNDIKKLIQKMTSINPQDRPAADEILVFLHNMQDSATEVAFAQPTLTLVRKRGVDLHLENVSKKLKSNRGTSECTLTQLAATDEEYVEVSQEFRKTSRRKIVTIEKVQNEYLCDQYACLKKAFEIRNDKTFPSERRLWHGADASTMSQICAKGFVLTYGGKNAVLYGQGVYFSGKASISERHCPPDTDGTCKLFYARALTGRYTQGDKSMRGPPPIDSDGNSTERYDCTVDNPDDPNIFVVYDNSQAYPEYIVTFR